MSSIPTSPTVSLSFMLPKVTMSLGSPGSQGSQSSSSSSSITPSSSSVSVNPMNNALLLNNISELVRNSGGLLSRFVVHDRLYIEAKKGNFTETQATRFRKLYDSDVKQLKEIKDAATELSSSAKAIIDTCSSSIRELAFRVRLVQELVRSNNESTSTIIKHVALGQWFTQYFLDTIEDVKDKLEIDKGEAGKEISKNSPVDLFIGKLLTFSEELLSLKDIATVFNKSLKPENKDIANCGTQDQQNKLINIKESIRLLSLERTKIDEELTKSTGDEHKNNTGSLTDLETKKKEISDRFNQLDERLGEVQKLLDERIAAFQLTEESIKSAPEEIKQVVPVLLPQVFRVMNFNGDIETVVAKCLGHLNDAIESASTHMNELSISIKVIQENTEIAEKAIMHRDAVWDLSLAKTDADESDEKNSPSRGIISLASSAYSLVSKIFSWS